MAKDPGYFMYFPGNYRWSAGIINMLSSAPYGGAEISELYKIGEMLKDKDPEDDDAWFDARVQLLRDGRALPHAEGREGARRLPHRRGLLPQVRRAHRHEDRARRGSVRGRQPAGLFRAGAEREGQARAVRRVLRRPRRHEG